MTNGKFALTLGALSNFSIAAMHLVMIVIGAPAYLYFGRADLAQLTENGSVFPALITFVLALIFAGFGLYALSGAGFIPRLPLLKLGLVFIGGIYVLRGLIVVLDILRLVRGAGYPFRETIFSAAALGIGLIYFYGLSRRWKQF